MTDVLYDELFKVVERCGQAPTLRQSATDDHRPIAQGTFHNWQKAIQEGAKPGLARNTFDALCRIPEVAGGLAAALLRRSDTDAVQWEKVAGELSRIVDLSMAWDLMRKLSDMKKLGMLDAKLSALEGLIVARRAAQVEELRRSKRAEKRRKSEK